MSKFSKLLIKANPTSAVSHVWILFVVYLQYRSSSKRKQDTDDVKEVKVGDKLFKKFTEGKVDMSNLAMLEFFMPVFLRAGDFLLALVDEKSFLSTFPTPKGRILATLFFSFAIIPQVEGYLPQDWANPTSKQQQQYKTGKDLKFRVPLYLWSILEVALTVKTLQFMNKSTINLKNKFYLLLSMVFFNGAIGITIAHELLHKDSRLEKWFGNLLMLNVNYMHWGEEHLEGHHDKVATPDDPASSRKNESLYSFLPRSFIGSFKSAWNIENKRLKREMIPKHFLHKNSNFLNMALPLAYVSLINKMIKGTWWKTAASFYVGGFFSALLLEIINYVEHYGLERRVVGSDADGKAVYEPVNPTHSWNSPHRVSNSLLFKLQRHSDHHTFSRRPYHLLRNFKESPQLPSGYPGMVTLALVPPVFFYIMNPLLEAHDAERNRVEAANKLGEYGEGNELKAVKNITNTRLRVYHLMFTLVSLYCVKDSLVPP